MRKLLELSNYLRKANERIAFIASFSVLLMLSLGFWNVIGRFIGVVIKINLSSNILIESQWYLFSIVFLFGIGWTLQTQDHVRVDILQNRWDKKNQLRLELLGTLVLLLPFTIGVLVISLQPAFQSLLINEGSPDPNGLPRYLVKFLIPLGFLFISLQGVSDTIENIYKLSKLSIPSKYTPNITTVKKID